MQNSKKLSVIIVNFRSEHYLHKCLASVYNALAFIDPEIIIVNNDPEAGLEEIAKIFPQAKIISHQKNSGFGAASNLGAQNAQGEYLFFLNPDTEISGDLSGNPQNFFKELSDERTGIVAPRLLDGNGKTQEWSVGAEVGLWDIIRNNLGFPKSKKIWESSEKIDVDWASGAALLIKKDLFGRAGGFDEKFFMYFEDMDLCRRVRQKNKRIVYFPDFKVKHFCGGSATGKKEQKESFYRSQDYFFEKHLGKTQTVFLKILRKIFK